MKQRYLDDGRVEVGVDEAGRGCLFGRVYTASVILPPKFSREPPYPIRDSKKLSKKRREALREFIEKEAVAYAVCYSDSEEIDRINILNASIKGMHRALDSLPVPSIDRILVDGNRFKPWGDVEHVCIVGGDDKYLSIASASILAKEYRDRHVELLCDLFPVLQERYALKNNKGYGTVKHREGIKKHGITEFHRKTYGICKNYNIS